MNTTNTTDLSFSLATDPELLLTFLPKLTVCNGMDVVNRTVFTHLAGWYSGTNITLDLAGKGRPSSISISSNGGGRPESMKTETVKILEKQRLYYVNFHYQGGDKKLIPYDICRVLLFTGSRKILDDGVAQKCQTEMKVRTFILYIYIYIYI
jgi:hypothetical protein